MKTNIKKFQVKFIPDEVEEQDLHVYITVTDADGKEHHVSACLLVNYASETTVGYMFDTLKTYVLQELGMKKFMLYEHQESKFRDGGNYDS